MSRICRLIVVLILVLLIFPEITVSLLFSEEKKHNLRYPNERKHASLNGAILRQLDRYKYIDMQKIINKEILRIRPGMTVLDIGTGTGQYAYKVAEALKGTGKVYATDIDPDLVDYVTQEAGRRELSNLYPVLVKKDGLDKFYTKQNYDLILVFHFPLDVRGRIDYFSELRNLLNENGRLIFTAVNCFSLFIIFCMSIYL